MALEVVGAFAAGVATGWIGRSFATSTRGAAVGVVAVAMRARDGLSRMAGRVAEWVEDVIAEGRARYEADHDDARAAAEAQGADRQAP